MIWNRLEDAEIHNHHFVSPIADIPKPDSFANCCDMVRELSKPFSFVRVDLYVIDGKPYFGEITFTPAGGGIMQYFSQEWLLNMGKRNILPPKIRLLITICYNIFVRIKKVRKVCQKR